MRVEERRKRTSRSKTAASVRAGLKRLGFKAFASKLGLASWIGSVQGAVATWSVISMRDFLTILTPSFDQVATAPCTDPMQE